MEAVTARPGVILVDPLLNLLASNAEAIQILSFPDHPEKIHHLDAWLGTRIRSRILDPESLTSGTLVREFRSARRTYLCRSFPLDVSDTTPASTHPALVLIFERRSNGATATAQISERYGLTLREQETVELLLRGLTSKEIAQRMKISPNTVKAFIRMVMVKMGVATRSAIVGKMVK